MSTRLSETCAHCLQTQLEYLSVRNENLELLQAFGANAWIANNSYLAQLKAQASKALVVLQEEIDGINKQRKSEQLAVAPSLARLQARWAELVQKTIEIHVACLYLQASMPPAVAAGAPP